MDGKEKIGLVAVCDVSPFGQRDENILFPRIDYLDIGMLLLYDLAQFEGHGKHDILLTPLAVLAHAAVVMAAVSRIQNHALNLSGAVLGTDRQ